MGEVTERLGLPLLAPGQAQKEMAHNEALALLDLAVQPVVEAVGTETPPADPVPGACWAVGTAPTGAWAGQAGAIAGWTGGGWRFLPPRAGGAVWSRADGATARFDGDRWRVVRGPAIPDPVGGGTADGEARAAIGAILATLRTQGLIAA